MRETSFGKNVFGKMRSIRARSRKRSKPIVGPIPAGAVRSLRSKGGARVSKKIRRSRVAFRLRRR